MSPLIVDAYFHGFEFRYGIDGFFSGKCIPLVCSSEHIHQFPTQPSHQASTDQLSKLTIRELGQTSEGRSQKTSLLSTKTHFKVHTFYLYSNRSEGHDISISKNKNVTVVLAHGASLHGLAISAFSHTFLTHSPICPGVDLGLGQLLALSFFGQPTRFFLMFSHPNHSFWSLAIGAERSGPITPSPPIGRTDRACSSDVKKKRPRVGEFRFIFHTALVFSQQKVSRSSLDFQVQLLLAFGHPQISFLVNHHPNCLAVHAQRRVMKQTQDRLVRWGWGWFGRGHWMSLQRVLGARPCQVLTSV